MNTKLSKLTKDKIYEIKQVFDVFDIDYSGLNNYSDLWMALMSLDYLLSESEVKNIIEVYDKKKSGKYNISTFYTIIVNLESPETNKALAMKAFTELSENPSSTSTIPLSTFNHTMTTAGERLQVADIAEIKRIMKFDSSSGEINLEDLAHQLFSAKLNDHKYM